MSASNIPVIDYRRANAADLLLPRPAILSSGWNHLHLEVFQQPQFEIAEHHHTMHVIACGLPGSPEAASLDSQLASGERWLDGKREQERRNFGDIAIIPAGVAHRCNWNMPVQFMVLAVEPALLHQMGHEVEEKAGRIELIPQFMNQPDLLIQGIFASLKAELEFSKMGGALLLDSLKTALAIHLLRNYCAVSLKLPGLTDGLSQAGWHQVIEYIDVYLHQDLRLVELSAIVQLSSYHFLRLFKQRMGITPHQYILKRRLEKARNLLKYSELNVAEIAMQTGFCDQSHLTRCFKRRFGITPKQFLQSYCKS